jgi:hypothetical protein
MQNNQRSRVSLVTHFCLIFGEKFVEHEDPNKEIISQLRAAGHLPVKSSKKSILDDIE